MNPQNDLVLVRPSDNFFFKAPFMVARYPVTLADHQRLSEALSTTPEGESLLLRATWLDAIRFCNRISSHYQLPCAYCEETGQLIDREGNPAPDQSHAAGFRLLTKYEWEYAARGWSGRKTGDYFPVQKEHFKIPGMDFPITDLQRELYDHGYSRKADMLENILGLHGMSVYGREWISDCGPGAAPAYSVCHWAEYYMNYNNDIGYEVTTRLCAATDQYPFRVAINQQDWTGR